MTTTYDQAITMLVNKYVAKWGENERAASDRLARGLPSAALVLNAVAHFDPEAPDEALASEARRLFSPDDLRWLKRGG
jgi:hypothetical protein